MEVTIEILDNLIRTVIGRNAQWTNSTYSVGYVDALCEVRNNLSEKRSLLVKPLDELRLKRMEADLGQVTLYINSYDEIKNELKAVSPETSLDVLKNNQIMYMKGIEQTRNFSYE